MKVIVKSPALVLIDDLLERNADVCVHDPRAIENVRTQYGPKIRYARNVYDTLENGPRQGVISMDYSPATIIVQPTNEELQIAQETEALLKKKRPSKRKRKPKKG